MNYCKWLILRLRIIKHFETLKDYLSEHVDESKRNHLERF